MKIAALTFAIVLALLPNAAFSQDASSSIKWKTIEAVEVLVAADDGYGDKDISIQDVFEAVGACAAGIISRDDLDDIEPHVEFRRLTKRCPAL